MRQQFLVVLVCLTVVLAGCAGWGMDGPSEDTETDGNESDLETATNETNDMDEQNDDQTDQNSNESADGGDGVEAGASTDNASTSDSDGRDTTVDDDDGEEGDSPDEDRSTAESNEQSSTQSPEDEDGEDVTESENESTDTGSNGKETPTSEDGDETITDDRDGEDNETNETSNRSDPETFALIVTDVDEPVTIERRADGATTTRDPTDGVVRFSVSEGGYYITADEYHYADVYVDDDMEIVLQDTAGATLDIMVVDAETGEPVPNPTIDGLCNLYYTSGDEFITGEGGEDGVIQAEAGVTPTSCNANVYAEEYQETTVSIDVPNDDGRVIELEPEDSATATNETVETSTVTTLLVN